MTALKLSIACDPFELVRGLHDGSVPIEGIDLQFQPEMTNPVRHKAMVRDLAFDICELNICTYLIAKEAGLPLTALPVFLFRKFRHGNIFINPDSPVRKPEDLAGVRIGCPNLQAAAVIWASGILQDAFGVDQRAPTWVTERDEDLRFEVPHDLKLERVSPGANLVDMLLKDEIGALITPQIPQAFLDRHPKIKRLFPDYRTREEAYFHESGLFPIMHVTAVRSELIEAHPWIAGRLMKGFETSKVQAY